MHYFELNVFIHLSTQKQKTEPHYYQNYKSVVLLTNMNVKAHTKNADYDEQAT